MSIKGPQQLQPTIGVWTSISIVVGGIIGSGIFMKPAYMASQLGSPLLVLSIWMIAGIITLFGALSNAEVAAMIPQTGGQYIFFQKMYGDFVAFMYGWAAFAVFNTAGNASIAYVLGTYLEYFISLPRFDSALEKSFMLQIPFVGNLYPLENIGVKTVTIAVVMGLTWINYRSTNFAGNVQVVFTLLKVLAMGIIVSSMLLSSKGSLQNVYHHSTFIHPEGWALVGAIAAATSGAFWGYDGWNNITFIAGEIQDPQRNIPRSLFTGILICICAYTLITFSYLYILPIDKAATSGMVASDAAQVVMGTTGGAVIALMIIISTFGTTNANVLATARVSFAMARERQFFSWVGQVHPRFKSPGNALWLQGVWTSILVLSGSFDMLTDMLVFVTWMFYALSAFGVFILRRKMKDTPRPYRVWGYPVVPAIFVLFAFLFLTITLWNDIFLYATGKTKLINSLLGLLLTLAGMPLYLYFKNKKQKLGESIV
jgi:APA family basic amino acid/polyamine antiporter